MKYTQITTFDVNNGPGFRVTLWVSGCSIRCPGCHNSELWDFNKGYEFTEETIDCIVSLVNNPNISGLTICGGEPLDQDISGKMDLLSLMRRIDKPIWLYTGHTLGDYFFSRETLFTKEIDVIVDGPYIAEQRDTSLAFRGSKNQRLIDVQKSLKEHKIVEL